MLINLYDVLSVPGKELKLKGSFSEQATSYYGEEIQVKEADAFEILVSRVDKDIVAVQFKVTLDVCRSCGRCLEDVNTTHTINISRTLNVVTKEAYTDNQEEKESISYIEDCTLDVDMLILDELYTVLPMNVLCKEDCKGICKVCGTNLNKNACDCDQTVPDPRMAVFSDIFNQFKEV